MRCNERLLLLLLEVGLPIIIVSDRGSFPDDDGRMQRVVRVQFVIVARNGAIPFILDSANLRSASAYKQDAVKSYSGDC
jgi:hypothetical protein